MVSGFLDILIDLVGQLAFAVAILAVGAMIAQRLPLAAIRWRSLGTGAVFGLQAAISVLLPAELPEGVNISTASASVALGGLFGGWVGGAVAFAVCTLTRIVAHEPRLANAILRTAACAIAGAVLAAWARHKGREASQVDLVRLSGLVIGVAFAAVSFAPAARQQVFLQTALLPLCIALVSGVLLLGGQFLGQRRHQALTRQLAQSEARMRDVLNNLPGTTYQMRLNNEGALSYDFTSESVQETTGATPDQIQRQAALVDSRFLPEEEEARWKYLRASMATMKPGSREFRMVRKDGSVRWLRTHSTPQREANGDVVWTGFTIDITEERRKDDDLRLSTAVLAANQRQLQGIVSSVPGVVYQICQTQDGTVSYKFISDGVRTIFGVEPEDAIRDPWTVWNTYYPEDEEDRLRALKESAEHMTKRERVFRIRRPDGTIRWLHSYSTPHPGINGETYWDGVTLDITPEKELEAQLAENERKLRSIVSSVPGMVYRTLQKPDGSVQFLFISDAVQPMIGISAEDVQRDATAMTSKFVAEDAPGRARVMEAGAKGNGMQEREFRIRRDDGSIRWMQSRSTPQLQPNGDIIWDGVTLDITDQKEMEVALRDSLAQRAASEERMRAIISSIPGAVYQIRYHPDGSSSYTFLSEGVRDLIGYSAAEALANQDLIHNARIPDDEPERMRASEASKTTMSLRVREFRGRHKDGSLRWFHSRSMPHLSRTGDIVWDGVTMDVTDRKRLEEEVRRSEHMLALGGLVDGVAHNFNNLLQIVSGAAELLLDSLKGHPDRPVADQILNATHRGSRLVNELRRFSLRQPASAEKVDVNALLTDMRDLAGHFVGAKVVLELDTEPDLWLVAVNPTRLQSVMLSLVLNSRDAMPDGGTVRIETRNVALDESEARRIDRAPGSYVQIRVTDTGAGMSPEVLKRATEPFFTTKPANQAGMGLSTVLAFVSQLGGRLSVESEQGVGTKVSLLLPAQQVRESNLSAAGKELSQRDVNS